MTHAENMRRARKTHCIRGHEFAGDNLVIVGARRRCRACKRQTDRAAKRRERA